MMGVAFAASAIGGPRLGSLRIWTVGGCVASALRSLASRRAASVGSALALRASVFALGVSNGAFAVAAIGSMMGLAGAGAHAREGTRMGLWGAAQAIAFGLGGVGATVLVDSARNSSSRRRSPPMSLVFVGEAVLFVVSAALASRDRASPQTARAPCWPAHGAIPAAVLKGEAR